MKRIFIFICIFPLLVFAQENPVKNTLRFNQELKVNYTYLGLGIMQLQYEKYMKEDFSYNLNFSYINYVYIDEIIGFNLSFGPRNYFTPEKPASFYVEPSVGLLFLKDNYYDDRYSTLSFALVLGRKWNLGNRITMDIYLGPSANIGFQKSGYNFSSKIKDWNGPLNGIFIKGGLTAGYRFN